MKTEFKPAANEVEIKPLKDFHIVQNEIDIVLEKGKSAPVPERFLPNLEVEGVIDKIPLKKG